MNSLEAYRNCTLCPRNCKIDRRYKKGFCSCTDQIMVARAALHYWEEPCISKDHGSGTIFFSGCSLKCCFCQNYQISNGKIGKEISAQRLGEIFLELQEQGANNINLVTAVQYTPSIIEALQSVQDRLKIPVVYNTGGYETVSTLKRLEEYVDIYLPDFKYYDSQLSKQYSKAGDYFERASESIQEMIRQKGAPIFDENGIMQQGVMIRHMVLPGSYKDSIQLLHWIKENLPPKQFILSIMSQYTPCYKSSEYPQINRRLTTYEYEKVIEEAIALDLVDGYMQEKSSAKGEYTPPFDLEGV